MDRKDYFYTIPRADAAAICSLQWKELLAFVQEKWPAAYIEGIEEIAPLQLSDIQEVFRFPCRAEDRAVLQKQMEPFFQCPETQEHFASVPFFIAGLAGMQCLARILERRIAAKYRFLLTGKQSWLRQVSLASWPYPEDAAGWLEAGMQAWEMGDLLADSMASQCLFPGCRRDERVFDLVREIKAIDWQRYEVLYMCW